MGVRRLETVLITAYAEERLGNLQSQFKLLSQRATIAVDDRQADDVAAKIEEVERLLERLGVYRD